MLRSASASSSLRSASASLHFFPEYLYTQFLKDNYSATQIKKLEATIKRIFKARFPQDPSYNSLKFLEVATILPYLKKNKLNIEPFLLVLNTLHKVPSGEITEVKSSIPFKNQLKEAIIQYVAGVQPKSTKRVSLRRGRKSS